MKALFKQNPIRNLNKNGGKRKNGFVTTTLTNVLKKFFSKIKMTVNHLFINL